MTIGLMATALPAGADDNPIANERQQLPADFYEQHWQVNCDTAIERAGAQADQAALALELQKCAALYNAKGAPLARACPDFALAMRQLAAGQPPARQHCSATPPLQEPPSADSGE